VTSVAGRLGVSTKSLYDWVKGYDDEPSTAPDAADQIEIKRLKAELRRVTDEMLAQVSGQNASKTPGYNASSRIGLQFLLNPVIYWTSGNINARRTVAKLAFAENLHYHRENGFSNPKTTMPFQLIQSLNSNRREEAMQIEKMVPPHGLEPRTP